MPPPVDRTGERYGRLVILGRGPDTPSSTGRSYFRTWLIRCDCGREETVRDNRIPHCESNRARSDVLESCTECAAQRTCKSCGKGFVSRLYRSTCSEECRLMLQRARDLDFYYRRLERDPGLNKRRAAMLRARAKTDPAVAARLKEHERKKTERHAARMAADPEYRERHNARARELYAARAAEVAARRRERRLQDPAWVESARAWARAYWAQHREEMLARRAELYEALSPERRQAVDDRRRELNRLHARNQRATPEGRERHNAYAKAARERRLAAMTPEELAQMMEAQREYARARLQDPEKRARATEQHRAYRARRALAELMKSGADLMARLEQPFDDEEDDDDDEHRADPD